MKPKILLVANWDWVLYNFRLPLARALRKSGAEVLLVSPPGKYIDHFQAEGFQWVPWKLERRSTNPFREAAAVFDLYQIYHDQNPDAVHHITIKPIFYGSLVARFQRTNVVINTFTGLGYLFSEREKARRLRRWVLPLLRLVFKSPDFHFVFLNQEDRDTLISRRVVPKDQSRIIQSDGVNLDRFHPSAHEREDGDSPVVLMAARLLWDKGIAEFVEAARMIKNQGIEGKFWVAGEPDPGNPACVPKDVLAKWKAEGPVEFLGHQGNMSQLLQMVDVAVLPSYHEGVPAFLLEAAASGLPLVASDISGCQVVVDEGKNGILIPPGNATKLAQAITPLLLDPEKRFQMGKESRKIAIARFDQRMINQSYIGLYKELGVGLK